MCKAASLKYFTHSFGFLENEAIFFYIGHTSIMNIEVLGLFSDFFTTYPSKQKHLYKLSFIQRRPNVFDVGPTL